MRVFLYQFNTFLGSVLVIIKLTKMRFRCDFVAVHVNWNCVVFSPCFAIFKNVEHSLEPGMTPSLRCGCVYFSIYLKPVLYHMTDTNDFASSCIVLQLPHQPFSKQLRNARHNRSRPTNVDGWYKHFKIFSISAIHLYLTKVWTVRNKNDLWSMSKHTFSDALYIKRASGNSCIKHALYMYVLV